MFFCSIISRMIEVLVSSWYSVVSPIATIAAETAVSADSLRDRLPAIYEKSKRHSLTDSFLMSALEAHLKVWRIVAILNIITQNILSLLWLCPDV